MKIKRGLRIFSFSSLIALYIAISLPKRIFTFSLAFFVMFIVFHGFTNNKYTKHLILSLCAVCVSCVYLYAYNAVYNSKMNTYYEKEHISFVGRIVDKQTTTAGAVCYTIKSINIDNKSVNSLKLYFYSGYDYEINDEISAEGKIKAFSRKSNYNYYYSNGIDGYFNADNIYQINNSEKNFITSVRKALLSSSQSIYSYNDNKIVSAMGLGDKSNLDNSTKEYFSCAGISHALVVSGLHTGIIILMTNALLYYIPFSKKIKNIILCAFVIFFMAIMNFTPSVIRAGVLSVAYLIGKNYLLEIDNYTVLSVVILFSLLLNPYSAINTSLLLSYSAYFGVLKAIDYSYKYSFNKILTAFCITLLAVCYSLPFMAMSGMQITLLSPFINLILSPFIALICVLSFFTPVLNIVPIINIANKYVLTKINSIAITILLKFAEFSTNKLSFAIVNLSDELCKILIFTVVISSVIGIIQFDDKKKRLLLSVCFTLAALLCYNIYNSHTVRVTCFDSGSNVSFVLTHKSNNTLILTESIKQNTLNKLLETKNIKEFDYIIYCSEKDDMTSYVKNLSDNVVIVNESTEITGDYFYFNSDIVKNKKIYSFDVNGIVFEFSFNKTDLTDRACDFYFFGADTPADFDAVNSYCFYPVKKSHTELFEKHNSTLLYDNLDIIINSKSGKYKIVEDVKNFGTQFQNN